MWKEVYIINVLNFLWVHNNCYYACMCMVGCCLFLWANCCPLEWHDSENIAYTAHFVFFRQIYQLSMHIIIGHCSRDKSSTTYGNSSKASYYEPGSQVRNAQNFIHCSCIIDPDPRFYLCRLVPWQEQILVR